MKEIEPVQLQSLKRLAASAFEPLTRASHVPGCLYTSEEVFQIEKERIWMEDWLCLGRIEELENPGDYMTFRILDEPVLVCRNEAGEIHAFANVCAHRGVEVAEGKGNVKEFSCPYHGWLYDLNGNLRAASYMRKAEGFDIAKCRLKPLALKEWAGWFFISFAEKPEPFHQVIAEFDRRYQFLQQEEMRVADRFDMMFNCNWKLLVENFLDVYHIGVLHAPTIGRFMTSLDVEFELRERGGVFFEYDAGVQTPDGKLVFDKIPWLTDKPERFSLAGTMYPNFHFFCRVENVRPFFVWPLAVDKSLLSVITLFPEEFHDRNNFDEGVAGYRQQLKKSAGEDRWMVESLQNSLKSRNFVPGRMSHLERGVQHVLRHHIERIFNEQ